MLSRSRWSLRLEAQAWRHLMSIGMYLHRLAPPAPPNPTFTRRIPTTLSKFPHDLELHFYTPPSYPHGGGPYPTILNFHGGGFTLGTATDDARWAAVATSRLNAVVVSVEYRLAPEYPFPTAVEDGADALLWLFAAARSLQLDEGKFAMSGFSAGGNMCFSVPLRVHHEVKLRPQRYPPTGRISAVVAFYPSTDFTRSRQQRRATNVRPDKELPQIFTNLFDASYLWPPKEIDLGSPYLSPGVADAELLRDALPERIVLVTCEWDELLDEAERFRKRLVELGKKVWYRRVEGVPHGWDKSPTPCAVDPKAEEVYGEVCTELASMFEESATNNTP